jgi:hypothetical protein
MPRYFQPMIMNDKHLTEAEILHRKSLEEGNMERALSLCSKTDDEGVQYMIMKYQHWHEWGTDQFPLIATYKAVLDDYQSILSELVDDPTLYRQKEYKDRVRAVEADLKLIEKGLGISQGIRDLANQFEKVVDAL